MVPTTITAAATAAATTTATMPKGWPITSPELYCVFYFFLLFSLTLKPLTMAATFITSEKNKLKLCDEENYIYEKHGHNSRKTKTYWRCERFYKGCRARLHTSYSCSEPEVIFSLGS